MILDTDALGAATHEVENQPPPLENYNLYDEDAALAEALRREGAPWAEPQIRRFGERCGEPDFIHLGHLANRHPPELKTHDRFGRRIDEVEFHPAWHELMAFNVAEGVHCLPWTENRPGAHVARSAMMYLMTQVEAGVGCPISMTFAAVPALRAQPEIAEEWAPRLLSREYDPRCIPASEKRGALAGMAMTEKQGGSDVRANTTRAEAIGSGGPGGEYLLTGHKWFCSAPMCDGFLTLARTDVGLSCFFVPRWTPDGKRNRIHIQRLKDKLGNRSNASSEIEYLGAWARMVGEEGRGVATIIEMVMHTRLDCAVGVAGTMRQALAQAAHHAAHRSAFGKLLIDQPLMQNVLADLAVETEAVAMMVFRLARAYDEAREDPHQRAFARLATAVGKYWACKRAPTHVAEALECLGGNGYVEESIMPRLYREAPLNSIWEGSGNVICLDVLRAMRREPESVEAFLHELESAGGGEPALDRAIADLKDELKNPDAVETRARRVVEKMALAFMGSLMVRCGAPAVRDAYLASRLGGEWGRVLGTLPAGLNYRAIIDRARPKNEQGCTG